MFECFLLLKAVLCCDGDSIIKKQMVMMDRELECHAEDMAELKVRVRYFEEVSHGMNNVRDLNKIVKLRF